jgi:3-oxoadipate enol-lactonase
MAGAHVLADADTDRTLVLSASMGTTHGLWDELIPAFAGRTRIVAVDHRGHGGAPAPRGPYSIADLARDVIDVLDDLGVRQADFAGVSLGGMVGLWLAAHAGERVRRLAVICTSAHMPPPSYWEQRAAAVRDAGSVEPIADAVIARWLTPGFAAGHPGAVARLREMLVSVEPEGYAGCCEAIAQMDLRGELGAIRAPTLVIAGVHDPATPAAGHGSVIAAAIAGARLEEVPAAHLANVERPDIVSGLLGRHFDPGGSDAR